MKKILSTVLAVIMIIGSISLSKSITVEANTVIESAISWAIATANDDSHGYSQSTRWGPDYDCSSFVISAFRSAGLDVGTASYTGNMRSQFVQHGFQWITWSEIGSSANLKRGDVLLAEGSHTELYLGNNQNVGAHSDRGYPALGDQTGTEVSVSGYYNHPWDGVLRYTGGAAPVCSCVTSYAGNYTVTTNSGSLNMRGGHSADYNIVTSIPKGSVVKVSKANGSWAHVEWNGYSGFCSMTYLTKIVPIYNPVGNVDSVTGETGAVQVRGWAFDEDDTKQAIKIHVYIGDEGHEITADKSRPDVNNVYGVGDNHGFLDTIPTEKTGKQAVSIYAINIGSGENVLLSSQEVTIAAKPDPLLINASVDKSEILAGEKVTISAKATGGSGNYTYSYLIHNKDTNEWYRYNKTFTSSSKQTCFIGTAGNREFFVEVKDSTGKVVRSESVKVVAKNKTVPLSVAATVSNATPTVGTNVTITAKAAGGTGSYTYSFLINNPSTNEWYRYGNGTFKAGNTHTWKVSGTGKRNFYVEVKDSTGKVVRSKAVTLTIASELAIRGTASVSATTVGGKVVITGTASGGTAPYTYSFLINNKDTGAWSRVKAFSSSNSYTWTAGSAGNRNFYIEVKDSTGKVVRSSAVNVVTK